MVTKEKMHTICRLWAQYKTEIKALKREVRELKQKLGDDVE